MAKGALQPKHISTLLPILTSFHVDHKLASNLGCDDFSLSLDLGLWRTPVPESLTLGRAGPDNAEKERQGSPQDTETNLFCGACTDGSEGKVFAG